MTNIYIRSLIFLLLSSIYIISSTPIEITLSSSMENKEETSYTIADNVISLILDGAEYSLTGSCSECVIEVGKITAQITLNSVSIESSSSDSGPFVISKEANIKLILVGESTIKDNGSKEGAGIKFKTGSILNISGEGVLNIISTAKNGIKGAKTSN